MGRRTMNSTGAAPEGLMIGGERAGAADGRTLNIFNPSNGQQIARVAQAGSGDIDRAVRVASATFASAEWGGRAPADRARMVMRLGQLISEGSEELAALETRDTGKPLSQSRADAAAAARYFEFFAGIADKLMGETIPVGPGYLDYTLREPIGVAAHIVPWNYPLQIASRGVAAALSAGCTVVLKPSSAAPLTCLRLGELALEAGLPPGALNVVPGTGADAGAALAGHPGVGRITFTGSFETGRQVAAIAAQRVCPISLELGGKSPNIVFADADLDAAASGVLSSIFVNAGQMCGAGSRLLVEREAHKPLLERLLERVRAIRLGPGIDDPDMGPLISAEQLDRVESYIQSARDEGAQVLAGGNRPRNPELAGGFFIEPTLIDGVSPDMRVAQEEIFGPVLAIIPFDGVDSAVDLANGIRFGLVAGIWTRDISLAIAMAERVEVGQVYVNTFGPGSPELPVAGRKDSGYGVAKGLEAVRGYLHLKNVLIKYG